MLEPVRTFQDRFGPIRFFMAPMAGITDQVFRTLIRHMGAQCVISELVSSEGLLRGGQKTLDLIRYNEEERPVGIQIFGSSIETMSEAAHRIECEGADFVDLNLGCPVRKVVCDGAGAAWLRDPNRLGDLLSKIKNRIRIPLTIKIRTGWDDSSQNAEEVTNIAAQCGVSWVAIHGRTRTQGYTGTSNWELIKKIAQSSTIPVIGNGDILASEEAIEKIDKEYSHGVMIGRGALKNPWIFQEVLGRETQAHNFLALIQHHFELALKYKGQIRAYLSLKKFLSWYASGYPHCSYFRSQIFQTEDFDALRSVALDYFSSVKVSDYNLDPAPFLMGGHG